MIELYQDLRPCCVCNHRARLYVPSTLHSTSARSDHLHLPSKPEHVPLSKFYSIWRGSLCWPRSPCGRILHRRYRRWRCQRDCSATQTLCGHGKPRIKPWHRRTTDTLSRQILMLIFAEVLGLYGMIVALLLNSKGQDSARVRIVYFPCYR